MFCQQFLMQQHPTVPLNELNLKISTLAGRMWLMDAFTNLSPDSAPLATKTGTTTKMGWGNLAYNQPLGGEGWGEGGLGTQPVIKNRSANKFEFQIE